MSHVLISLLLFAQVGPDAIFFLSSLSLSLPLLLRSLSVFVPVGPVVQLKLSVTQRNQIGFHLQSALAAVRAAQPRSPLALETSEGFPRDAVVISAAFESPLSFTTLFLLR